MTPEEAVEQLADRLTTGRLMAVAKLIDACVATAKANAKKEETLRCADVARMQTNEYARQYRDEMFADCTHVPSGKHICDMIAEAILTTGGLEAEE